MKKIYIIDEYISSTKNGIGRYTQELCSALITLNIDTSIIELNSESKRFDIKIEDSIKRICIPYSSNYFVSNSFVLVCLLKMHVADAIENIFIINHSPCKLLIETLKRYFPLSKIIFVIHDLNWTNPLLGDVKLFKRIMINRENPSIQKLYNHIIDSTEEMKDSLHLCDKVICLSSSTKRLLEKYYDISKEQVFLIPNFLADKKILITEETKIAIKKKYNVLDFKIVLSAGRLTKSKGALALIKSFKKVLKKHTDALLVFAGGIIQSDEIFKAYQDVCNRVLFLGHIQFEELLEWYQIADIGAVPSYTEQCSYAGIEMLMFGLPIVASDAYGVNDMFQNERNAIVAKIENYKDSSKYEENLANAIIQLLDNNELLSKLSQSSRKTYEKKFRFDIGLVNLSECLKSF